MTTTKQTSKPARPQPPAKPGMAKIAQQTTAAKPATVAKVEPTTDSPIGKLRAIEAWSNAGVIGRAAETRSLILGLVAGLNVLFIGPPGTAKTQLVERVTSAFCGKPDDLFSTMLTKFTKPAEIFGPTDIAKLQEGELSIDTTGYLPEARVGVIDECFKGSSAILNSLLTIANERRFKNGHAWQACPNRLLVGMSNEFPEDPVLLAAFFDRFPIKRKVGYLERDDFGRMLGLVSGSVSTESPVTLTDADFATIDGMVRAAKITPDIIKALSDLRDLLKAKGVVISDRRWAQCIKLLRAAAVYDGRDTVVRADLDVLRSVLWDTDAHAALLQTELASVIAPYTRAIRDLVKGAYSERAKVLEAARKDRGANDAPNTVEANQAAGLAIGKISGFKRGLEAIESKITDGNEMQLFGMAMASINGLVEAVGAVMLGEEGLAKLARTTTIDIPLA